MQSFVDSRHVIFKLVGSMLAVAVLAATVLLCARPAMAAPMRCSGEQQTCIAGCNKSPNRSTISTCVTHCGARHSACMKTGCWDSGSQRYCGLLKQ